MYSYYALKAMRIKMPKFVSLIVTTMQIIQMMFGLWICCYVLLKKQYDTTSYQCQTSYDNLRHSFIIYFTYFLLFLNFFLQAYVFKGKYKLKIPYLSELLENEPRTVPSTKVEDKKK